MMGQTYPIYDFNGTNHELISPAHGIFCGSWRKGFFKVMFEEDLLGRVSKAY